MKETGDAPEERAGEDEGRVLAEAQPGGGGDGEGGGGRTTGGGEGA